MQYFDNHLVSLHQQINKQNNKIQFMDVQRQALLANGRSRTCGRCPLGVADCTDTIKKICRDAFVEGYKKGYEQSKKDNRISRNDVIREYYKRGGIL